MTTVKKPLSKYILSSDVQEYHAKGDSTMQAVRAAEGKAEIVT